MKRTDCGSSSLLLSIFANSGGKRPFILPAGLLSALPLEALRGVGLGAEEFASVYDDPQRLAEVSFYIADNTGVSNLSLPSAMRAESEAYGGEKDVRAGEPGSRAVFRYPLQELSDYKKLRRLDPKATHRMAIVLEVLGILSRSQCNRPVIGDLVGPLSLASSLIDGTVLFRAMSSERELLCEFLDFLTEGTIVFARAQARAGARAFFLIDPFASLDALGAEFFRVFALPYINRIAQALRSIEASANDKGIALIVHICGEPSQLATVAPYLECACLSLHGLERAGDALDGKLLAGGVDMTLFSPCGALQNDSAAIVHDVKRAASLGFQIIAPSCSLDANLSFAALRAATDAAKALEG